MSGYTPVLDTRHMLIILWPISFLIQFFAVQLLTFTRVLFAMVDLGGVYGVYRPPLLS